ncbi:MAG: apolipoprotein N-acyltransferase [Burkholderiaceae bacterium]
MNKPGTPEALAAPAAWPRWAPPLLALGAGAASVLAFAPFGLWPLQIATLALLFWLALDARGVARAALCGWLYGFGCAAAGIHWLYVSLHDFGGMPAPMAVTAVLLLALYLGAFAALALGTALWLRQRWQASRAVTALLLLPALWALAEWLRGWVFTGFPWLASGYAHSAGPLAGYAPLVGVYGLGLIAAAIAGALVLLPARKLPAAVAVAILAAGFGLRFLPWTAPHGQPLTVRLLQGAVPQEMKFDQAQLNASLALYRDMIEAGPADLVATPETAIPVLLQQVAPAYLQGLRAFAERSGSHLLLGAPVGDSAHGYTNSALGFAPQAEVAPYRYDKHHLVPFGEFIPYGFRWFVDMMHIPLGDFARGAALQPAFAVRDQAVLPNICYEDLFGEEIAAQLAAGHAAGSAATMLLNMSNIAWFGDTIALPQHLQISQMRALETGRPMLRATNTGATAVIGPDGRVAQQLPPYARGTLAATVQGMAGWTPYMLFGNRLLLAAIVLALGAAWLATRRSGRRTA